MYATVLAIHPGPTTGYAIVHGQRADAIGFWKLLEDAGTPGADAALHDVRQLIAARKLQEMVEHEAMAFSVDAIIVTNPSGDRTSMRHPLHRAIFRAAYAAKCASHLVDADCWFDAHGPNHSASSDAGEIAMRICAADGISVPRAEAALAVMIGRNGSARMGILPFDAITGLDGPEPDFP